MLIHIHAVDFAPRDRVLANYSFIVFYVGITILISTVVIIIIIIIITPFTHFPSNCSADLLRGNNIYTPGTSDD